MSMMDIKLLKYHVVICPRCGLVRTVMAKRRWKCFKCGSTHSLLDNKKGMGGGTRTVIKSFWLPLEAADYAQKIKRNKIVLQPGFEHE